MKLSVTKSGGNNVYPRLGDVLRQQVPILPRAAMPKKAGNLRYKPRKPYKACDKKTTLEAIKLAQKLAVQNRGRKRAKHFETRNVA